MSNDSFYNPRMKHFLIALLAGCTLTGQSLAANTYAVVISKMTAAKSEWKVVADALIKKHAGKLVVYEGSVTNCLPALKRLQPRYTAFVETPENIGRVYVAEIHRLTRQLDDDPYGDTLWGIVSAATPAGALRVANATEPRVIHSAIGNTGINEAWVDRMFFVSDGKKGEWVFKDAAGKITKGDDGEVDRTRLFVEKFNLLQPDLMVTSGHATERNLEMPFSRGNTIAKDGHWTGMINWKEPLPIPTNSHPRVFLGAGNCLIGNFHNRADTMAPTLMENYGVNQFIGYVVPTWYGKGGWGTYDLWNHLFSRYSLAEAWFFNNQIIIHDLLTKYPDIAKRHLSVTEEREGIVFDELRGMDKEASGMLFDRDVVAFYGDPALRVTFDPKRIACHVDVQAVQTGNTVTITVKNGDIKEGVRTNFPICLWLPNRLKKPEVVTGKEFDPVVTHNFVMLFKPDYTSGKQYKVVVRDAP
jgi:hypothetical protein